MTAADKEEFMEQTRQAMLREHGVPWEFIEAKIIEDLEFDGGCNGNLKAIKRLVVGHSIDEIIPILRGNLCKNKGTSCADQLTYALEAAYKDANP